MKIQVIGKTAKWNKQFYAKDLDQAHELGYFSGNISRWEFMDRVTRYNPQLRTYANQNYRGLFDSDKGRFVLGISHNMTIPKYSIFRYDKSKDRKLDYTDEHGEYLSSEIINTDDEEGKMLVRGWKPTLEILEGYGYKIDWKGL